MKADVWKTHLLQSNQGEQKGLGKMSNGNQPTKLSPFMTHHTNRNHISFFKDNYNTKLAR